MVANFHKRFLLKAEEHSSVTYLSRVIHTHGSRRKSQVPTHIHINTFFVRVASVHRKLIVPLIVPYLCMRYAAKGQVSKKTTQCHVSSRITGMNAVATSSGNTHCKEHVCVSCACIHVHNRACYQRPDTMYYRMVH